MKLYDCFVYFNEDTVLDIRLHELDSVVDYFVIAEATKTHQYRPKPLNFDINKFPEFKDKIIYVVVDDIPDNPTPGVTNWLAQQHQCDALVRGLAGADDNDIAMLSDLDEIPRASTVKEWLTQAYLTGSNYRFILDSHYWWLNSASIGDWPHGPLMTRVKNFRDIPMNKWKARTGFPEINIYHSGWHYSYIGDAVQRAKKLESFAHMECNNDTYRQSCVEAAEKALTVETMDDYYPLYVRENIEKFKQYMKGIK